MWDLWFASSRYLVAPSHCRNTVLEAREAHGGADRGGIEPLASTCRGAARAERAERSSAQSHRVTRMHRARGAGRGGVAGYSRAPRWISRTGCIAGYRCYRVTRQPCGSPRRDDGSGGPEGSAPRERNLAAPPSQTAARGHREAPRGTRRPSNTAGLCNTSCACGMRGRGGARRPDRSVSAALRDPRGPARPC